MEIHEFYQKFSKVYDPIVDFERHSLPLCAAETVMSDFVRLPLSSFVQEKYVLGSVIKHTQNNFIGSNNIFKIYDLLIELCKNLFHCNYADGRTLTGVNTISTLLMTLFENGDTIYITDPEHGGHSSMPIICKRLGIKTIALPYDYEAMDFCYDEINNCLNNKNIKGMLISLSDILFQPDLSQIDLSSETIIIYDATQILGLIATEQIKNFFDIFKNDYPFILAGSTHKTLPGPTNGLIMTNSQKIVKKIDLQINPDYLRNVQMHQILSLIFSLEEFSLYGREYMNKMVENSNMLAEYLKQQEFDIIERNGKFSDTHQIFMHFSPKLTHSFYLECQLYNITLNERYRKLYRNSGIRLGVQQISRYGWGKDELKDIAGLLKLLYEDCKTGNHYHYKEISSGIKQLVQNKTLKYTISTKDYLYFAKYFQ